MLVASSIYLINTLQEEDTCWSEQLKHHTGYDVSDLEDCAAELRSLIADAPREPVSFNPKPYTPFLRLFMVPLSCCFSWFCKSPIKTEGCRPRVPLPVTTVNGILVRRDRRRGGLTPPRCRLPMRCLLLHPIPPCTFISVAQAHSMGLCCEWNRAEIPRCLQEVRPPAV